MAITTTTMTKNRAASIKYAIGLGQMTKSKDGKVSPELMDKLKQDGFSERALKIFQSGKQRAVISNGNVALIDNPEIEMRSMWQLKHAKSNKEAEITIQSFSHDELDPRNVNDWKKANILGAKTARKRYGDDVLFVVYTHVDNMIDDRTGFYKTPHIHNHIIAMNCHLKTGKSINYHNQHIKMANASNEVLNKYGYKQRDLSAFLDPKKRKSTTKTRAEKGAENRLFKEQKNKKEHKNPIKNGKTQVNSGQTDKGMTKSLIDRLIYEAGGNSSIVDFQSFKEAALTEGLEVVPRRSPQKQGFTNVTFINHNILNTRHPKSKQKFFAITSRANGFQEYTLEKLSKSIKEQCNKKKDENKEKDIFEQFDMLFFGKSNKNSNEKNNNENNSNIKYIPSNKPHAINIKWSYKKDHDQEDYENIDGTDSNKDLKEHLINISGKQIRAFIELVERMKAEYQKNVKLIKKMVKNAVYHAKEKANKVDNQQKEAKVHNKKQSISKPSPMPKPRPRNPFIR